MVDTKERGVLRRIRWLRIIVGAVVVEAPCLQSRSL